ncbi:ABC transporter ATP-binding protein [Candidatus Methylacidiphilum infernorum]|uniref:ABC-type multidrug transport system, ATPase component n=1 Tax=Methylacidiphilum infernorum (isolate V4) TaxID=481448 RepID=B3DX80_METI4|nr:ABC transporter ATP-binding protein [Candidatus Methylacidiphilum infernorum]ACD83789.1 ABC-type multidrug transport system, ATPase component [Methylacidiphilum infernorum V4]
MSISSFIQTESAGSTRTTRRIKVEVKNLSFSYGERKALNDVSFEVEEGTIAGILGPNGSGKTTLFRILSTLLPLTSGSVKLAGFSYPAEGALARSVLGIVFQSPSLDKKLTVEENLQHQGHLYNLHGKDLRQRIDELLELFHLSERKKDLVETLSGGLQRRVEVAKGILHQPEILILDEPSTGIDPAARREIWNYLFTLRNEFHLTILVTTHLMEEAERCDKVLIMDKGKVVAWDSPDQLRSLIPGLILTVRSSTLELLEQQIVSLGRTPIKVNGALVVESKRGENYSSLLQFAANLLEKQPNSISALTIAQTSLEDVFLHLTGHQFLIGEKEDETAY